MDLKRRVWKVVQVAEAGDRVSRAFDVFLLSLISLNVLAVIIETVEAVQVRIGGFLWGFEVFSVLVFTVEYLARVWSCTADPAFQHPIGGRLRFALTPLALVDLLAILPFYLPLLGIDLRFVRSLRLFRMFRLLKLGRYVASLRLFARVIHSKKEELILTISVLLLLLVIASSLMYYAEHEAQPEMFSSIPAAMWWAVATLTTVGYGDVYPITALGKMLASVVAVLGIGLFALPAGILGAGFVEAVQQRKAHLRCPHCGRPVRPDELVSRPEPAAASPAAADTNS